MSKIRHSRINKFRKRNWKAVVLTKLITIWILFSFSLMYLTGNTAAYFNDHSAVSGIFTAGFWEEEIEEWDKSSLEFVEPKKDNTIISCEPTVISATIKNTGNDMQGTTEFFVYYSISDNPMKGEKIYEGVVNPIKEKHTEVVEFQASLAGNYKFKALHRPGHGNKYDSRQELWSETIKVECKENKSTESKNVEEESAAEDVKHNDNNEEETESKESNNEENVEEAKKVESDVDNSGDTSTEESEPNKNDQSDAEVKTNNVETTEKPDTQEPDENTSSNEEN